MSALGQRPPWVSYLWFTRPRELFWHWVRETSVLRCCRASAANPVLGPWSCTLQGVCWGQPGVALRSDVRLSLEQLLLQLWLGDTSVKE